MHTPWIRALALVIIAFTVSADHAHAAIQSIGYDCSLVAQVGRPLMPPIIPEQVNGRRVLFLSKADGDTLYYAGNEFQLSGGTHAVRTPNGVTLRSSASTAQILKLLASTYPASSAAAEADPTLLGGPDSYTYANCDDPLVAFCSGRPLHSRLPNDESLRVVHRWEVWHPLEGSTKEIGAVLGVGYVYETDRQTYYLDSLGWIVPISDRKAVLSGLKEIPKANDALPSYMTAAVQGGRAQYLMLSCGDGKGSCKYTLALGTTVNATASTDLVIEAVQELDFVEAGRAHQIGFVYAVRSGVRYLGAGLSITPFSGRDVSDVMRSLIPLEHVDALRAYAKDPNGWSIQSTNCAGDPAHE
ncbi:MAG: hypothetical protein JOY86_06210 [Candidatus Eremiobacteraeota bacterium]|nr:hypothetical protein [Candidatus Eremiobacteraeota bacterium]